MDAPSVNSMLPISMPDRLPTVAEPMLPCPSTQPLAKASYKRTVTQEL